MLPKKALKNIRFGVATNSSSSHSIIHNGDLTGSDNDYEPDQGQYGWEFFTLASKEAKERYMISQLNNKIPYETKCIACMVLESNGEKNAANILENSGVDHQSQMAFPQDIHGNLNLIFFNEYKDYIVNEDFVVLGGNDNSDNDHELAGEDTGAKDNHMWSFYPDDKSYKNGNYWVVMNERRKLRVIFTEDDITPSRPELIDLKITDHCDIGCKFCYQDSTAIGKHADLETIKTIIKRASDYHSICEFAIGGGEPTQHPDFPDILRYIHNQQGVANFTTKNKKWFENEELVKAARNFVTGVAYSVDNLSELMYFYNEHTKLFTTDYPGRIGRTSTEPLFYVHIIPELMGHDKFREMIGEIDYINEQSQYSGTKIHVTLLGFKPIGRALGDHVEPVPEIIDVLVKTQFTPIGIDTKFASDYQHYLDTQGIDKKLYTTEEGEYSMYIDAVEDKAYKSSYHLDNPVSLSTKGPSKLDVHDMEKLFQMI